MNVEDEAEAKRLAAVLLECFHNNQVNLGIAWCAMSSILVGVAVMQGVPHEVFKQALDELWYEVSEQLRAVKVAHSGEVN